MRPDDIEKDWFEMKTEEAVKRSPLSDREKFEIFVRVLGVPYEKELMRAFERIKNDYLTKVSNYESIKKAIKEFWDENS